MSAMMLPGRCGSTYTGEGPRRTLVCIDFFDNKIKTGMMDREVTRRKSKSDAVV